MWFEEFVSFKTSLIEAHTIHYFVEQQNYVFSVTGWSYEYKPILFYKVRFVVYHIIWTLMVFAVDPRRVGTVYLLVDVS